MTSIAIDQIAARQFCERLARTLERRDIAPRGQPYLQRFYCGGWSPRNKVDAPSLMLHHFVASDPDHEVHSHPWAWSASLILVGGYVETRCDRATGQAVTRMFRPGDVNVLLADDRHRIELIEADCWTLFLAGPYQQPWGFAPGCER